MNDNCDQSFRLDVAARQAITDCILRNALACDMLDVERWKDTYWPDGREDHGWSDGNAHRFIDETVPFLRTTMDTTWHQVGNVLIELDGATAKAVSYFFAYCRIAAANGARSDLFSGGRYIDRFERRDGTWRIAHRISKGDWIRNAEGSFPWGNESLKGYIPRLGLRDPDDPARVLLGWQQSHP